MRWNVVVSIRIHLSEVTTKFRVSSNSDMLIKISQIVVTASMWGTERLQRSTRLSKINSAMALFSISLRQQKEEYRVATSAKKEM